jgi:dolichol kinase
VTPEPIADRALVLQLHGVLSEIDPVRWRDEEASGLKRRLYDLQKNIEQRERLAELAGALRTNLPTLEATTPDLRTRWLAFKQSLQPAYERIATSLREAKIHVPTLRPTNWARSAFHVSGAAFAIVLIEWIQSPVLLTCAALVYAVTFWLMELARRRSAKVNEKLMGFFKPISHAHEANRVNSSTWYATALVALTLTQSDALCAVAVGILGVGDPLAALVGRRFGRIRLLHGRSLEGSLTFFLSGGLVAFGLLRLFHPELALGAAIEISAAAAFAGALAEVLSLRVDDNLSVPLAAAAGGAVAMLLL